jgi:hypothetical protein
VAPRPAPVARLDGAAATGRRLCFVSSQSSSRTLSYRFGFPTPAANRRSLTNR